MMIILANSTSVCEFLEFSSVQLLSRVQLFVTPWTTARQASLSITNFQNLPKPMSIESVMPSNRLILCHPPLLLPSIFPSIRSFQMSQLFVLAGFNISPSNEYPGLFSFRMDWLDLLAVQGPLKSLLQHHSSKASVLWCSAFFMVQLSHELHELFVNFGNQSLVSSIFFSCDRMCFSVFNAWAGSLVH